MDAASSFGTGIDGSARWSLRLLGDFQLSERASGEKVALPGKRERVLLAYLALSPNGRQPRRKLVTLLWGEAADETTLENLRTAIFNLRKALGDTEHRTIGSEDRDIVLDTSAFQVDVLEFRRLSAGGATAELEEATKLYSGDFLEGLSIESEEFESWRREESSRCKGQLLDALTGLMGQLAAAGENERTIDTGLRILRLEPLHEGAVSRLMRLYASSGRRAAAVKLYRTLAETLKKELGAQPEAETRAVYAEITLGAEGRTAVTVDAKPPLASPTTARPSVPAEYSPAASVAPPGVKKKRTIGWIAAGAVAAAAVIAVLSFVSLAPSTAPTGGPPTVVAATSNSAIALAVLPFANLSSDPEQEYFSDGLTEEIGSALAKIPDLRIVARTSVREFKDQARDIRAIGEQLGVSHLIEGAVRRAGDRVRITVQLINAGDGTHIWSNDYDRRLTDIFAIQEDIARAIAEALRAPLGLEPGGTLVSRTDNVESYEHFLRARALYRARFSVSGRPGSVDAAVRILEPLVNRDPSYAAAWGLLAQVYVQASDPNDFFDKADKAAKEAIRLDPQNANAHAALADMDSYLGRWTAGYDAFRRALELDPNEPDVLARHLLWLALTGRTKEALALGERLTMLEPFVPVYNSAIARFKVNAGQIEGAIATLEKMPSDPLVGIALARAYALRGRYAEAANVLVATASGREDAAGLLRAAPRRPSGAEQLPALEGRLHFVYAHIGSPDRILENPERNVEQHVFNPGNLEALWGPESAPLRKTERFKKFVRDSGLLDYWRERGWADVCRPVGADDFVCE